MGASCFDRWNNRGLLLPMGPAADTPAAWIVIGSSRDSGTITSPATLSPARRPI